MVDKEDDLALCVKNYLKSAQAHCANELSDDLADTQFEQMLRNNDVSGAFQSLLITAQKKSFNNSDFWRTMKVIAEDLHLPEDAAECSSRGKS